ncbi:MAG: tetratricopeptide repeat protein [Acidobacteria bacterium]|nr:tetratricopeptide repeat protein [Acidobacteriota bacterium]
MSVGFNLRRYILFAVPFIFAVVLGIMLVSSLDQPSPVDYRLARGRALLETENYLAALKALRDVPENEARGAETRAYLGAAYLRLHLYKAAIKEFEEASKLRSRMVDPAIGLAASYIELGDAAKAVEYAKRATELEPRSADAWIIFGRAHWLNKGYAEAEKAGLKARELEAPLPAISDLLLNVYISQGDAKKFEAELGRAAKPTKPIQDLAVRFYVAQAQFIRAYELQVRYDRERIERSILETELALRREPGRMDLYPDLIKNLVKVGRYTHAIETARQYRGDISLDLELAKAYWMSGQKDAAIEAYRRASAGGVHKLLAEVALAVITDDVRHWREAFTAERVEKDHFFLAQLERTLSSSNPLVRSFVFRYAGIYDSGFYNQAAQEALRVLDKDPRNFDALMTIATAYHRLGRIDDATRYMETASKEFPNSAEPVSRLANLALSEDEKDVQKIVGYMERAVRLDPNNAGYLYNVGWIYDQIGDTNRAISYYQRAIRASSLSFEAMNNLALIYGARGEVERALPLLRQAIRSDPENEAGYINLAEHYVRQRDWKNALDNYDHALRINPSNPLAAVEKGKVLIELGRFDEAVEVLNQALELDAHSYDAYVVLASAYEKMGHTKESAAATEEAQRIRPIKDSPK